MVALDRRDCIRYDDGYYECYRDGFWYSDKGVIVKWCIFAAFVLFFLAWFVGGYIHAKKRMKKGLPLMGYHRWLVPYNTRRRYGQVPQNHFTFYNTQQPYGQPQYHQRNDGSWSEAPPVYNGGDAPPSYYAPPGATKVQPNQASGRPMNMPQYGNYGPPPPQQPYGQQQQFGAYQQPPPPPPQQQAPQPQGPQQSGIVGSSSQSQNGGEAQLPERPEAARTKISNLVSRFNNRK